MSSSSRSSSSNGEKYLKMKTVSRGGEAHDHYPTSTTTVNPAGKLDGEHMAELREIFRSLDSNKDGSLTQLELGSLLRSFY